MTKTTTAPAPTGVTRQTLPPTKPNQDTGSAYLSSKVLLKALESVGFCIETSPILPVLDRVKLTFTPGSLELHTSNLHNTATLTIPTDGPADGIRLIPYRILKELLKALPEQPVTLSLGLNKLSLAADQESYDLPSEDPATFPKLVPLQNARTVQLTEDTLAGLLAKLVPFISTDETRPAMNALCLKIDPPQMEDRASLTFMGTDGHTVCRRLLHLEGEAAARLGSEAQTLLIPRRMVALLAKRLSSSRDELLTIRTSEARAEVSGLADGLVLTMRLADQTYPNVAGALNKFYTTAVLVSRHELIATLERLGLVATVVGMDIQPNHKITLEGDNLDLSRSGRATIMGQVEGDPLRIGLEVDDMLTALRSFDEAQVWLEMNQPSRPVEIRSAENRTDEDVSLAMPSMLTPVF